jgi:hypothetical protein
MQSGFKQKPRLTDDSVWVDDSSAKRVNLLGNIVEFPSAIKPLQESHFTLPITIKLPFVAREEVRQIAQTVAVFVVEVKQWF